MFQLMLVVFAAVAIHLQIGMAFQVVGAVGMCSCMQCPQQYAAL